MATFGTETRAIFSAGVQFGWRDRVVRPLLFVSLVGGVFYMYGFYSWQPYVLGLLGKNAVWTLGIVQAGLSLTSIAGNALVKPIMRTGARRRDPARVLAWTAVLSAILVRGIAVVGLLTRQPGVVPFSLVVGLWLVWGVVFGVSGPVSQAYLNENIPSAQRATVLSLVGVLRRRRWGRGPAGTGLGVPADVDRGRLAHRRRVRRADCAALSEVGPGGRSEDCAGGWQRRTVVSLRDIVPELAIPGPITDTQGVDRVLATPV